MEVAVCVGVGYMHAGIEIFINFPGHPKSTKQHYFSHERLYKVYPGCLLYLHLNEMFMLGAVILVSTVVLRMSVLLLTSRYKVLLHLNLRVV